MSIYSFRGLCHQTPTLGVSQGLGFKNPNPLQECIFPNGVKGKRCTLVPLTPTSTMANKKHQAKPHYYIFSFSVEPPRTPQRGGRIRRRPTYNYSNLPTYRASKRAMCTSGNSQSNTRCTWLSRATTTNQHQYANTTAALCLSDCER